MKTPRIANALNQVDDDIVSGAVYVKSRTKTFWFKWSYIAACFVIVATVLALAPMMFAGEDFLPPINSDVSSTSSNETPHIKSDVPIVNNEGIYEKGYFYGIDEGTFSTYVGGKVITEDKIGRKISDVSVTAGWKNDAGEWIDATEKLRGEVYTIEGVSENVAVALKFIDKGEAVTTTHYYVIMNPGEDLTLVEDYIITVAPSITEKSEFVLE